MLSRCTTEQALIGQILIVLARSRFVVRLALCWVAWFLALLGSLLCLVAWSPSVAKPQRTPVPSSQAVVINAILIAYIASSLRSSRCGQEAGFSKEDAFTLATVIFFLGIVLSEAFEQLGMCIFRARAGEAKAQAGGFREQAR